MCNAVNAVNAVLANCIWLDSGGFVMMLQKSTCNLQVCERGRLYLLHSTCCRQVEGIVSIGDLNESLRHSLVIRYGIVELVDALCFVIFWTANRL